MKFANEQKTSWELNGEQVTIKLNDIQSAMFFTKSNVIAYLVGDEKCNPNMLMVYSMAGTCLQQLVRPEGYQFIYLTSHPKVDVAVVCGVVDIEKSKESWSDFYFGLDLKTGVFSKIGIAR